MEWKDDPSMERGSRSVVPAEEHDDAALDDVEPGPVLLEAPAQASSTPLALPHKLHLCFNTHTLSLPLSVVWRTGDRWK